MDYEARMDARNDHNAQVAYEARQEFESEIDGICKGAIEAGDYDVAVLQRAAAILAEEELFQEADLLREIAELKAK